MKSLPEHGAVFTFRGALCDFFRDSASTVTAHYRFNGHPSIKDAIEAQGVPHPEVGGISMNGRPVGFRDGLLTGARVEVLPEDPARFPPGKDRLRPPLPGEIRFVLDVNLGKLARWLRLLGFDALYRNDFTDAEVARLSAVENRAALTRDRRLLHQKIIVHGYWVRSDDPETQVHELLHRFDLARNTRPLCRCVECNGLIHTASKEQVWKHLEPKTKRFYNEFYQCARCSRVYWPGSHSSGISAKLRRVLGPDSPQVHEAGI